MGKKSVQDVPRYFEPYVSDCFNNAYGSLLTRMGYDPRLVLADYLSFMYEQETGFIGTNFLFHFANSVEFSEEQLNTSFEFIYLPATQYYREGRELPPVHDRIQISMNIHDDGEAADKRLRELLDENKPVIVFVDLYDMPYHPACGKEHGLHAIVITGYDDEQGVYEVFDRYELSSGTNFLGTIPKEDIRRSRQALTPCSNPIAGSYNRPVRNLWIEMDEFRPVQLTRERLLDVVNRSCRRMEGGEVILGQICGLERIDAFRQGLLRRKEGAVDERFVYFFRSYLNQNLKVIARSRRRFKVYLETIRELLPEAATNAACEALEESAKRWDICANVCLKLGITKSLKLIDDLDKHLQAIMDLEKRAIQSIGAGSLAI
ncbi:BtrH N-terminal domain-containing protein [Paenibacillus hexagrammi]|uniref:BtrH N-terminal domain-containing protein n=1 Tax=Paenibacillus hexagrammi TaxID=2908839 RepID=A0ABY3SMZ5_9BACL|nr:BtrH N-terminal domain-containing protein [Paenibacillus sp. YPD9-1]UJF34495.1 BtrH N-terminal domain-containing protein [Paenibacillus sp. YPD9-1]